jgi:hypothetical protein
LGRENIGKRHGNRGAQGRASHELPARNGTHREIGR